MNGFIKSNYYGYLLALCVLALLLALAWSATAAAQVPAPFDPGNPSGPSTPGEPELGDPMGAEATPAPVPATATPAPTSPSTPGGPGDMNGGPDDTNGDTNGGTNGGMNGGMNGGTNGDMMKPKPGPHAYSAPGRIVRHAATPAQLIISGDGLQYYYVGVDGSTVTGPHIPSFSDLAAMYPSGAWVSLLSAPNPLTGKHVNVDYLPNEQKIKVSTFYPDNEYDTNKPYIFNFGSDHVVNVEAW